MRCRFELAQSEAMRCRKKRSDALSVGTNVGEWLDLRRTAALHHAHEPAAVRPPLSLPMCRQFFRPTAMGRNPFTGDVVDREETRVQVSRQRHPVPPRVSDRLAHGAFGRRLSCGHLQPLGEGLPERTRPLPASLEGEPGGRRAWSAGVSRGMGTRAGFRGRGGGRTGRRR